MLCLFGGAELLTHSGEYKVVCLDYGAHNIRHNEFVHAMKLLGVDSWEHWDGDLYKTPVSYNEDILIPKLKLLLEECDWKKVVTHNSGGEYGHYRHIATHNLISKLIFEKVWVFDTCSDVEMSIETKNEKGNVLKQAYPSQKQVLRWFNWQCEKISKLKI